MAAKRGDDKAWKEFISWCGERGLKAVPANPWTLAAYARWSERHHPYPTVAKNIEAIAGSTIRKRANTWTATPWSRAP